MAGGGHLLATMVDINIYEIIKDVNNVNIVSNMHVSSPVGSNS